MLGAEKVLVEHGSASQKKQMTGCNGKAFAHLAEMHIDELANLWSLWRTALSLPQYDGTSIQEIERRIQAHIAGVRVHEQTAWEYCEQILDIANADELFAASQLAFRSYDVEKIRKIVETAVAYPHTQSGLITALAWLPFDISDPWLEKFSKSKELNHKFFAVEAYRWRGETNPEFLVHCVKRDDCMQHEPLARAVLRSLAEFKVRDALPQVEAAALTAKNEFWRQYCYGFWGGEPDLEVVKHQVMTGSPNQELALQTFFRIFDPEQSRIWISELIEVHDDTVAAVYASAILGDAQAVPWLIGLMRSHEFAKLAGAAFSEITGCDLESHQLHLIEPPQSGEALPTADEDEVIPSPALDALPWPNVDRVWSVWQDHLAPRFKSNELYLAGEVKTVSACERLVLSARQPIRKSAAFELAVHQTERPLRNTHGIQLPER